MEKNIEVQIQEIQRRARGRSTAFSIGNTADRTPTAQWHQTPIRETSEIIYGGVIVYDRKTAKKIAHFVDGKIDHVFVDAEKKMHRSGRGDVDLEIVVRSVVRKSNVLTYKGNDLATETVDMFVGNTIKQGSGARVAIIGMGNLGAKIALKLVERGFIVSGFRRDQKKLHRIIAGLNEMKPPATKARITAAKNIAAACRGARIVIGTANDKGIITGAMLKGAAPSVVLIDAGKGCFADDVVNGPRTVYRTDIEVAQKYLFSSLIAAKSHDLKKPVRRTMQGSGITLVESGVLGRKGEVIVDNVAKPARIIGVVDDKGLLQKLDDTTTRRLVLQHSKKRTP